MEQMHRITIKFQDLEPADGVNAAFVRIAVTEKNSRRNKNECGIQMVSGAPDE